MRHSGYKMVHEPCGEAITVQITERIPCDNKVKNCECCKKMTDKLSELQAELSSCREIIRILQEEFREINLYHQPTGNQVNKVTQNKELYNSKRREDWTYQTSVRRRYHQYSVGHPRKLSLETSNRYATPPNLNEDSEHSRYVTHVKRYQKMQNQLEKH